jgi:RNA polymerase sigma-70 factor (ECF subfamily)
MPPSSIAGRATGVPGAEGDLAERVRSGDIEAYGVLLLAHGHSRRLRAWLAARVSDPVDVEELAQDAFVTAFQQIRKFRPGSDFGAWLRRIAWQLLRQSRKRYAVRQRHAAEWLAELAPRDSDAAPDDPLIEFLEQCLERVPGNTRALLGQKYRDGLSSAEMAAASGQSEEWVRLTLYRARRELRECIEQRRRAAAEI